MVCFPAPSARKRGSYSLPESAARMLLDVFLKYAYNKLCIKLGEDCPDFSITLVLRVYMEARKDGQEARGAGCAV